jgi:hypothetical protein
MRVLLPRQYHREKYLRTFDAVQVMPDVSHFDPELGYFTNPHLEVSFDTEEFQTRIHTNSLGFRDDEESLDNPEVLFVGDSFCFGWGVGQEETFESLFEEQTGLKSLNMGVSGYGTIQQYLLFQRYSGILDVTGKTAVFSLFYNDLGENKNPVELLFPTLVKKSRRVFFTTPLEEAYEEWQVPFQTERSRRFTAHSYVADLVVSTFLIQQYNKRGEEWHKTHKPDTSLGIRLSQYETFEYTMRKIKALARSKRIRLAFVYVPRVEVYSDPEYEDTWISDIESILSTLSLPLLDLTNPISREDYFALDGHWNASGHRKCADEIRAFLFGDDLEGESADEIREFAFGDNLPGRPVNREVVQSASF